jgi:hypothetical protein
MAAWIPLIKTAMPYVAQVLSIAVPAFTARSESKKADEVVPEQIAELQNAVTQNAESVKILAEQLKETIQGVDAAAMKLQRELEVYRRRSIVAMIVAVVSAVVAMLAVFSQ